MANRQRFSQPLRGVPQRRLNSWIVGPEGTAAATIASTSLFTNGVQATADGLTAVRIRGDLNIALSTITSSLDGFGRIAVGICIVSENAGDIGVTAIPSPLDDILWGGWMWYWTGSVFGPSTTVTNSNGPANVRIPIDGKAMRKFKQSDVMFGVIQVANEIGSAVITAKLNTRVLVKLP